MLTVNIEMDVVLVLGDEWILLCFEWFVGVIVVGKGGVDGLFVICEL